MLKSFNAKNAERPNLILFTRWDRFSRNTADAYYMITLLKDLGIEPQAMEQILDMSIPENKVILAMYIVTYEVENDRRTLNVKQGMYRARKEGYWLGKAPLGYTCTVQGNSGKRILQRREPEALLIKRAFLKVSENCLPISVIYRKIVLAGLSCNRANFYKMLRNPLYCGKIHLPGFNGNALCTVPGKHEGIVTEELFNSVQEILLKELSKFVFRIFTSHQLRHFRCHHLFNILFYRSIVFHYGRIGDLADNRYRFVCLFFFINSIKIILDLAMKCL